MDEANAPIGTMAAEALDLFIAAVEATPPESRELPSNMDDWTVGELVGHATGSAAKVVALVENREVWGRSEPSDWVVDDPAVRLRELAAQLRDALPGADFESPRTSPGGEVPLHQALAYPVSDLALHSWDLHRSQGRIVELPDDLLAFCGGLVESLPEDMLRRPGAFGPAQPSPDDATPTSRLMAHLGRSVD